jgi:hypothetical protein
VSSFITNSTPTPVYQLLSELTMLNHALRNDRYCALPVALAFMPPVDAVITEQYAIRMVGLAQDFQATRDNSCLSELSIVSGHLKDGLCASNVLAVLAKRVDTST